MKKLLIALGVGLLVLVSVIMYPPNAGLSDTQLAAMREACVSEAFTYFERWNTNLTGDFEFWGLKQKEEGTWLAYVSIAYTTPNHDVPFHYTRMCVADIDGGTVTNVVLK